MLQACKYRIGRIGSIVNNCFVQYTKKVVTFHLAENVRPIPSRCADAADAIMMQTTCKIFVEYYSCSALGNAALTRVQVRGIFYATAFSCHDDDDDDDDDDDYTSSEGGNSRLSLEPVQSAVLTAGTCGRRRRCCMTPIHKRLVGRHALTPDVDVRLGRRGTTTPGNSVLDRRSSGLVSVSRRQRSDVRRQTSHLGQRVWTDALDVGTSTGLPAYGSGLGLAKC